MVTINEKLDNVHFEHKMWLDELAFCLNELAIYEKRLTLKYKDYDAQDLPEEILELWDQIKSHKKRANDLIRHIKKHVFTIRNMVHSNGELSKIMDTSHPYVRQQIIEFRKDYVVWKETLHELLEGFK